VRELPPAIIDEAPRSTRERWGRWLRARRLSLAAVLALAEVLYVLIARPGTLLFSSLALIVLVLAALGISRLGPGIPRDLLLVLAIAQALVLVIPLVVGVSFLLGIIAAVVILVVVIAAAFRLRI
jgi:hypothetical protein